MTLRRRRQRAPHRQEQRAASSFSRVQRREGRRHLSFGIDDNLPLFPGSAEHTINKTQEDVSLSVDCGALRLPVSL